MRINFTADDVARTQFSAAPAPMMETWLAMVELRRASVGHSPARTRSWLGEARQAFPSTARPLLDLIGPRGPWPGFIDSMAPDLAEALDFIRATPRSDLRSELAELWGDRPGRPPAWLRDLAAGETDALESVVRALRDLHDVVVAPRWEDVLSSFHGDVARRMPAIAEGGHRALFGMLHEQLRWRHNGLERPGREVEYELGGGGLLLVPVAFWTGPPLFVIGGGARIPDALLYSARPNGQPAGPGRNVQGGAAGNDSLAALLGATRAAVLRTLREPHGTIDLAGTVGISPASASEHAKVLRDASLIETRREGRSVRHSLTPLGRTMLGHLRPAAGKPDDRPG